MVLPIQINQETIRDLKRRGLHAEASSMLQAYYQELKSNREQIKKELKKKDYLITKQFGVCTACKTYPSIKGQTLCKSCRFKHSISNKSNK